MSLITILISVLIGLPAFVGSLLYWGRYYKLHQESICGEYYSDKRSMFETGIFVCMLCSICTMAPYVNLVFLPGVIGAAALWSLIVFLFRLGGKLDKVSFKIEKE
jgi:hypothetical protein